MKPLTISALSAAVAAFVFRSVLLVPFLEDGRLRFDSLDDGAIPAKGEVFFSLLMFAVVVGAAGAFLWVRRRHADDDPSTVGTTVAITLVAVFALLDLILNLVLSDRTFAEFLINQVPDYSPLIVIPLAMGAAHRVIRQPTPSPAD